MDCYVCENEATRQCRRCARVYCEVHGGDLCAECLNPASALPSFNLYRGSLLALLIGTAIALWLLVQPPGSGGGGETQIGIINLTPTLIVTEEPIGTPETPPSPTAETPAATGSATPEPTATVEETPAPQTYVVQSGDTLTSIAEQFAPAGVDPFDYAEQIASASGLSSTSELITTGQVLVLP